MNEKKESARYVILGNVDSGKSSFIGVLEKNVLDDGNGYSRSLITKLKHELESGKTSSHSYHYLIKNNEITTLIDLCGHEKYLSTTIFGVMGLYCDYGIVMIGANMGLSKTTLEHIGLLISKEIQIILIITKIDICPDNILAETKQKINFIMKKNRRNVIYFDKPTEKNNITDTNTITNSTCINTASYLNDSHKILIDFLHQGDITSVPTFLVSNKTGFNIELVKEFLQTLRSKTYIKTITNDNVIDNMCQYPPVLFIDNIFNVHGIGIILSGTLKYGDLCVGQKLYVGPVDGYNYVTVTIRSIKNCVSETINRFKENDSGSIGIKVESKFIYTKNMFRKGQIATTDHDFARSNTHFSFNSKVAIFRHSTTIKNNYQIVVHSGTLVAPAKFIMPNDKVLRTNSKDVITIKFLSRPVFILPMSGFIFREGKTMGGGTFIFGIPNPNDTAEKYKIKKNKLQNKKKKKIYV
jgi:elongation factor 1-alpha